MSLVLEIDETVYVTDVDDYEILKNSISLSWFFYLIDQFLTKFHLLFDLVIIYSTLQNLGLFFFLLLTIHLPPLSNCLVSYPSLL